MIPRRALGLAGLLSIACVLTAGLGTASATTLCKENSSPCPESKRYAAGTLISSHVAAADPIFLGTINQKCDRSNLNLKTTAQSGTPLGAEITTLSFSECTPCTTVEALGLPYKATFSAIGGGDGSLAVSGLSVKFSGCPFGVTCTFAAGEMTLEVDGDNSSPFLPEIFALKEPMKRTAGSELFCGNTAMWDGEYTVTSPLTLFVSAEP